MAMTDLSAASPPSVDEANAAAGYVDDAGDFDSSSPGGTQGFGIFRALMLGLLAVTVGASVAVVAKRSHTGVPT
jgi:hypothetical protein